MIRDRKKIIIAAFMGIAALYTTGYVRLRLSHDFVRYGDGCIYPSPPAKGLFMTTTADALWLTVEIIFLPAIKAEELIRAQRFCSL